MATDLTHAGRSYPFVIFASPVSHPFNLRPDAVGGVNFEDKERALTFVEQRRAGCSVYGAVD